MLSPSLLSSVFQLLRQQNTSVPGQIINMCPWFTINRIWERGKAAFSQTSMMISQSHLDEATQIGQTTVNSQTAQGWTVQAHFYVDFFPPVNILVLYDLQFMVGWICRYEELWTLKIDYVFNTAGFDSLEVWCPNPLFSGQLYTLTSAFSPFPMCARTHMPLHTSNKLCV